VYPINYGLCLRLLLHSISGEKAINIRQNWGDTDVTQNAHRRLLRQSLAGPTQPRVLVETAPPVYRGPRRRLRRCEISCDAPTLLFQARERKAIVRARESESVQDVATGAHAVERIAEATGILPATVFRTARTLREADQALWPKAEKGGGRGAAHVEPTHLANLVIGLAAADPITSAPKVVAGYRALICPNPQFKQPESRISRLLASVFVTADNFGSWLEGLVHLLSDPDNDAASELTERGFFIDLVGDPRIPRVVVSYIPDDQSGERETLLFRPQHPTPHLSRARNPASNFLATDAPAAIMRTATLFVPLFSVLGDLWNHTQRYRTDTPLGQLMKLIKRDARRDARERRPTTHQPSPSQPDAPASDSPENENAAYPCQGSGVS
jgi:hypothetical protein